VNAKSLKVEKVTLYYNANAKGYQDVRLKIDLLAELCLFISTSENFIVKY
jgi:hypothetical protein